MKDIDFDELDKAVNSLMATTKPANLPAEPAPEQPDVTLTIPSSSDTPQPDVESPVVNAPVAEVASQQVTAPTPVVVRSMPPATRRSGRFMDMVNKPTDTKVRPMSAPVTAPSREGLAITPRGSGPTETPDTAPVVVPVEPTTQAAAEEPATYESMPDPIDVQQGTLTSVEPTDPAPPVEQATEESEHTNPPLGSLESPFLSDTKVEKRPLNSGVPDQPSETASFDTRDDYTIDTEAKQLSDEKGADEPPSVPQVAELESDLVAIESAEEVHPIVAIDTTEAAEQVAPTSTPLGASSIAQQYVTQPSSGDQSHAAIYDGAQYPEPVAHPAKNKSGWLWVLWVIVLLGVGAGGAIVLYNLGIIP